MAKVGATETAGRVVDRSVQSMGRFGLVRGSKIERLYREARPMRIYEGGSQPEVILDSLAKKLVKDPVSRDHRLPYPRLAGPHRAAGARDAGDGIRRFGDGTAAGAIAAMRHAGVDRSVVLAVADAPQRLEAANAFVGALDPAHFIGFGTVHAGSGHRRRTWTARPS